MKGLVRTLLVFVLTVMAVNASNLWDIYQKSDMKYNPLAKKHFFLVTKLIEAPLLDLYQSLITQEFENFQSSMDRNELLKELKSMSDGEWLISESVNVLEDQLLGDGFIRKFYDYAVDTFNCYKGLQRADLGECLDILTDAIEVGHAFLTGWEQRKYAKKFNAVLASQAILRASVRLKRPLIWYYSASTIKGWMRWIFENDRKIPFIKDRFWSVGIDLDYAYGLTLKSHRIVFSNY